MGERPPGETGDDRTTRLSELDAQIKAARAAKEPKPRQEAKKWTTVGLAWRMVFELVVSMAIGLGMGWGLDRLFGTIPLFLVIFWLLGFAAGIRTVMHTAREVEKSQTAQAAGSDEPPGRARD